MESGVHMDFCNTRGIFLPLDQIRDVIQTKGTTTTLSFYFLNFFTGLSPVPGNIPQIHILQPVLRWIRVVRTVSSEAVLHAPVQSLRLDPRRLADSRHTELSDHPEYI